MSEFVGRVIVVTGAAAGLGRATAIAFARLGASLGLVDVNDKGLAETADEVRALGADCLTLPVDISSQAACADAVGQTVARFGSLYALCNVAGIILFSRVENTASAMWERMFAVNVHGPFYLCQSAMPHILRAQGAVVNVASSGALMGHAYMTAYTATKGALVSMTQSLAMEYVKEPVRINAIAPGGMITSMATEVSFPDGLDMELVARFQPVRPYIDPAQVADMIVYLASDRGAPVHGAVISVDAGASTG